VTNANILIANRRAIVIKGNKILRFRKPGIPKVRLVIKRLVNDIVVLTPAKITESIAISCEPTPVYLVLDENGVIKAQPAKVNVRLEHFVKNIFFRRIFVTRLAANQNDSE